MITQEIYNELVKFRDGPAAIPDGPTPMIEYLVAQGWLRATEHNVDGLSIFPIAWEITIAGKVALSEYEKSCEKEAKGEKQQRFQNQVSVAQVLVPAVTFVLGLVVEFRTGIVGILLQLFG